MNTGPLAIGACATVPIHFQALHLQSDAFVVTSGGVPAETWQVVGGLSTSAPQPAGTMTICRTHAFGGTFSSSLRALFLLRYQRLTAPFVELQQDCGLGDCPEVLFLTSGQHWSLAGHPTDPLPAGVQVDVDADGIVDLVSMIGKSNFQGGINSGGGGGGGGGDECDEVEHVANDPGPKDHSRSSHSNYAAGGDEDGNGTPDHCECEEEPCEEETDSTEIDTP